MAQAPFKLDVSEAERLQKVMDDFAGHAGRIVDDVLHEQGGKLIEEEIMMLLPVSGRTWAGKKPAAKHAQPFVQENGSLSVTIKTKPAYHYLYFPDDGSNTKNHRGGQNFMERGAQNQAEKIIDLCIAALTNKIGE